MENCELVYKNQEIGVEMNEKYKGVIPAFYACYDKDENISASKVKEFTKHLINKGVQGLYVCGSSGECIYQNVQERKTLLEAVMEEAKGKITIIAHVACNNTKDSIELAKHAESLGVDAIAAIPPIYFKLPESAIAAYWNAISQAAPNTDFIIYNIPQLAGVSLTMPLLEEMLKNKKVIGVKNSSMPVQDIQMFKERGGKDFIVFNGPDEQFAAGLMMGACGGIGGTYALMPELYLAIYKAFEEHDNAKALLLQNHACSIIYKVCEAKGNLYATMKEIIKRREGLDMGSVRLPLAAYTAQDDKVVTEAIELINNAIREI